MFVGFVAESFLLMLLFPCLKNLLGILRELLVIILQSFCCTEIDVL